MHCSLVLLLLAPSLALAEAPKLAVMPLAHVRIEAAVVRVLDEVLLSEVDRLGRFTVLGASDINAMLGLERMKDSLGCDAVACAAEIGGALGAELLLSGSVGVLGEELIISASLIDIAKATVVSRERIQVARDERRYAAGIVALVSALFGDARTRSDSSDRSVASAVYRSLVFPGWGQVYKRQVVRGSLFAGLEVLTVGVVMYFHFVGSDMEDRYNDTGNRDFTLVDKASQAYTRRYQFFLGAAFLHALNVADAAFAGMPD